MQEQQVTVIKQKVENKKLNNLYNRMKKMNKTTYHENKNIISILFV